MFFNKIINCTTSHLIQIRSQYSKQKCNLTSNLVWKGTLFYFAEFLDSVKPECEGHILLEPLWFNEKIDV